MFVGMIASQPLTTRTCPNTSVWLSALYPYHSPDVSGHVSDKIACLVEADIFNTPHSHHLTSLPLQSDNLWISFWGRLDNRTELIKTLNVSGSIDHVTDHTLIHHAWLRWQEDMPKKLIGDFALVILNRSDNTVFLARDPMGKKPLYYCRTNTGLAFSSVAGALLKIPNLSTTPDTDWMMRFILGYSHSKTDTAFKAIKKVPPAHSLRWDGHDLTITRYHNWADNAPHTTRRDDRWVKDYRAVLDTVIADQSLSRYNIGVENSGGIDSATIASFLANRTSVDQDTLHSMSYAVLENEAASILETSQRVGINSNLILTQYGPIGEMAKSALKDSLEFAGYPFEHGIGLSHWPFYVHCRTKGIRTLFSGFSGDECVTNYGQIAMLEMIDRGMFLSLCATQPGGYVLQFLRGSKAYLNNRTSPEYNPNMKQSLETVRRLNTLRDDKLSGSDVDMLLTENAKYDAPYRRDNDWLINGLLSKAFISNRFECGSLLAAYHGVDYRWPLGDVRLIQQYLSTPIIERRGPRGMGRYLHRRAISGIAPDAITWQRTKYMGEKMSVEIPISKIEADQLAHARLHPLLAELLDSTTWQRFLHVMQVSEAPRRNIIKRQVKAVIKLDFWLKHFA